MKHFEINKWTDFVRDLVSEEDRRLMQDHLLSGCPECLKTVDTLRELYAVASAELSYEVPDYAIHNAKAVYALQQLEKVYVSRRLIGRLIYDSFREPLPAGVRARHRLTRHALYEAGDYSVDLRLEHQRGTPTVTLVGQVANNREPDKPLPDVPVCLMSGKELVGQTIANAFGEFQIEYEPTKHLRLYVQADDAAPKRIEVRLNKLTEE